MATDDKNKFIDDKIEESILNRRRIFLSDAVDQDSAKEIIRKLWYLETLDNKKPILFIINSPGGAVDSGFAIWDNIKLLTCPVYTLVTGLAASMGSLLSLVAEKGKRFATANSRIMIHQPLISGVIRGQATDLDIQAKEMLKTREMIVTIYADATGKDPKDIEKAIDRDNWMSPIEAKEFGLIDKVVGSFKDLE
ncbi:MAG: ATP-dependent Clp protease proteolytic subunit 1 [Candidatus Anoxychlamydiales bacterium]|nr:ATP-dependent Clp protease proteolytic subunit 1 [Candidatus Anoxychlamydiales bacterium]NGX40866.1 ATP-dependent Clp protease proteolytic subunit 1 [Candidatus Anoxychlamydiales bacterium]HEU64580.1 ATP-dependent Clp protease proteolytic subunit [Chlamydiota bacterium]